MFGISSQMDSGFMSSQSTQTTSSKSRDAQPMIPVTVKQISESIQSTDDRSNFLINGADVSNVKLLGLVFNKAERVTDVSFVIDDGTGRIDCTRWINETVDKKEVEEFSDEMYVRVHGHLKVSQGKKQLVVFAIRPVTNYNEIANHFLECIYIHSSKAGVQNGGSVPNSAPLPNSSVISNHLNGLQSAPSNEFVGQYSMDGLKDIEKKVIDYLQQPSSLAQEKGVHRNEIAQQLKVPLEKIMQTIESLESEGLVYSTIDECHYKSISD